MYSPFQLGIRFLKYYVTASNGRGHGIHSPFVYAFITRVLNDDRHFYAYTPIENLRQLLLLDNKQLTIEDFDASSRIRRSHLQKINEIAASSLKPKKFGQLLFRIVDYFDPKTILELGTSLGVTTAYLASGRPSAKVITMEGSNEVAEQALRNFEKLQLHNIELVKGNFDETLSRQLPSMEKPDLVFLDGNHQYAPTLRYYHEILPYIHEDTVLIFDDIHWSSEMEKAWTEIKMDENVTLSIDLFFMGLVFFRKENLQKQHFTIRF